MTAIKRATSVLGLGMLTHKTYSSSSPSMASSSIPSIQEIFERFELQDAVLPGVFNGSWKRSATDSLLRSFNPSTTSVLKQVSCGGARDIMETLQGMRDVRRQWQAVPAPKRGAIVAQIRDQLVTHKPYLGALISYEMGKIYTEGLGEVQEYIDICEYAVGLSRSMAGLVLPSERREHVLLEQWNPLGIVGVISAFNFPLAVYGWNAALALVTGNCVLWKPAPTTSLIAIAMTKLTAAVFEANQLPSGICSLVCGEREAGEELVASPLVDLVSFTGSTAVGRQVGVAVAQRFGRSLLECGGNNAAVVMADADMDMALHSVAFAAIGTAGQRCTSLRRLYLHEAIAKDFTERLVALYGQVVRIGDALHPETLCGPLHCEAAVKVYEDTVAAVRREGGHILFGGSVVRDGTAMAPYASLLVDPALLGKPGLYVVPTITARLSPDSSLLKQEAFVPVLHIQTFGSFEEAVQLNNGVSQGLSSALFTRDPALQFKWMSHVGSDCGIVNVNVPTSGAEIGGAFGGNKETGWGRESGSDSWKAYCRRATCTISYANQLELAQGVNFST